MPRHVLPALTTMGILALLPANAQDIRIQSTKGFVTVLRGEGDQTIQRGKDAALVTDDRIVSGPAAEAQIAVDEAHTVEVGPEAEIRMGEVYPGRYQMILLKGGLTWSVRRPSAAEAEVVSPSVKIRPREIGTFQIGLNAQGDTVIVAVQGDVEVWAPAGSQWVREGETMLARGPADDPEFKMLGKVSRWKRFLSLVSRLQVGGVVNAAGTGGSSSAPPPRPASLKAPNQGNQPVHAPEPGHPHAPTPAPTPSPSHGK